MTVPEVVQGEPGARERRTPQHPGGAEAPGRLPWSALLAMAATGFVIIVTETAPAGLLPQLAAGLGISQASAGQLVSAYALGTVVAAVPAIRLTRQVRRKPLLLSGIAGFVVANTATALADDYVMAMVARLIAGAFSGLLWGMIAGYARAIVPSAAAGRGLAVAMAGTPVALSLGTPLGSFAGTLVGWRWTFTALSVLSLALIGWVIASVPDRPGQSSGPSTPVLQVARIPGIAPVLLVVFAWMLAHNVLYTYIAPYLAYVGVPGRADLVLLVFGLAALAGIWCTGRGIDRALRKLVLASLAGFALTAVLLGLWGDVPSLFYLATVLWGGAFGGAATQLQTASADAAGAETDVAQAMLTTVFNLAIFGGGALGATLLETAGPTSFPWAVAALVALASTTVLLSRRHGFPSGPRAENETTLPRESHVSH
ncbi:MFS transporter [Streptomyces sp. KR2]|uniref:MFS transporter n=1 Tax=Streptomyces sp. KR2 TaxID=1514824 RepID=UPI003F7EDE3C